MDSTIFTEAFKKLELLEEEDFNIGSQAGIEDAIDFNEEEVEDNLLQVIDDEAETEEELENDYLGDVILECEVCHSLIYKKPDEIQIDEETQTVNTQEECPLCMSVDGYKVIGQVAPFKEEGEVDLEVDGEDVEVKDVDDDGDMDIKIEDDDDLEESYKNLKKKLKEAYKDDLRSDVFNALGDVIWNHFSNGDHHPTEEEVDEAYRWFKSHFWEEPDFEDEDDLDESCKNSKKRSKKITEGINGKRVVQVSMDVIIPEDQSGDDVIEVIERNCPELYIAGASSDYDMTDEYADDPSWFEDRPEANDFKAIKAGAEEFARQFSPRNEGMSKAVMKKGGCKNDALKEGDSCPECGKNPCECEQELDEGFNDVSITTDDTHMEMTSDENGKVTVTTEPVGSSDSLEGDTMLAPLEDDTIETIADAQPDSEEEFDDMDDEYLDVDIDEFDEEGFDELGESYLKRVYENVNSFRTTAVKSRKNLLKVEGVINFKSGSKKKTSFIFEAKDISKKGKIRFIGENKEITRGRKAFTVSGTMKGNKFMCESLNYNYQAKNSRGKSTRLYGTIRRAK